MNWEQHSNLSTSLLIFQIFASFLLLICQLSGSNKGLSQRKVK